MPLDPSIGLQTQTPNPANMISGFLDLGRKKLELNKAQATYGADVSQRNAEAALSNTNAQVGAATAQPRIDAAVATAKGAQATADTATLENTRAHVANIVQTSTRLLNDPDLTRAKVIESVFDSAANEGAPTAAIQQAMQGIPKSSGDPAKDQEALRGFLTQSLVRAQNVAGQIGVQFPQTQQVNTSAQTFPVAGGNPQTTMGSAPGTPVGPATAMQIPPDAQEGIQTDAQGKRYIVQKSPQGVIVATREVPGSSNGTSGQAAPGPVNLPPNETPASRDQLMTDRNAAQAIVRTAPEMHNINREVYNLADSNVQTGHLGGIINRVSSAFGFNVGADEAADYNTLGKYLARANAQLAQTMGLPNTNAGAEQANTAGGSPAYDKTSIKRIAVLNDALVTGSQLYQKGLENAIAQNGIFGKRQFDQQWSGTADVDAMAFKNAVDSKNPGQQQMILTKLGGKGSPGVKDMLDKLHAMRALAGEQ